MAEMVAGSKNKSNTMKYVLEVVSIAIAVFIAFFITPTETLSKEALLVLGVTVWAVINWILNLTSEYVIAIMMAMLWFLGKAAPVETIMSGFSSSTWWLLVGVMGMGAAVSKSGLLKRLSMYSLKIFKPTYQGQVLGMIIMGILISPLIPSTTAKCAIMGPLVLGIANELDLPKRGAGRFGLLMAMWLGFNISGNFFISGSFQAYLITGNLPAETQAAYTWMTWFIRSLPWSVTMTVLFYLFIRFAYKAETSKEISKEYINEQLGVLGKLTRDEKITSVVLACSLIMFVLEQVTGVTSMTVALIALCVLNMFKVVGPQEFTQKTLWPLIVFVGVALGMGNVFGAVGLNQWISGILTQVMGGLTNPYLFVTVLCLVTFVVRILLAQPTSNIILTTLFWPLAAELGMDPWIAGIIVYHAGVVMYPPYVHPNLLVGYGAAGGEEYIDITKAFKADIAYMVICLLGLLVCVPFWQMLGMI